MTKPSGKLLGGKALARSSRGLELGSSAWPKLRRAWGHYLEREQTVATRTTYLRALDVFTRWLRERADAGEEVQLGAVMSEDVTAWRDYLRRRYSVATVNLWLSSVRSFYNWAISRGVPIENPARAVKGKGRKPTAGYKREAFTDQEVVAVFETCSETSDEGLRDRAMFSLFAYCGLRTIEVQRIELGDLDRNGGRLIVWVWGKGRQEPDEFVVIPASAEPALRAWIGRHPTQAGPLICSLARGQRGGRLSLRRLRAIAKNHIRSAGIVSAHKTTHSFRHSAITNAIRHGATPLQAQHMARHADVKTTIGYFHELDRLSDPAEDRIDYQPEASV